MEHKRFVVLLVPLLVAFAILGAAMGTASSWSGTDQVAASEPAMEPLLDDLATLDRGADVFGRPGWRQILQTDEPGLGTAIEGPESLNGTFIEFAPDYGGDACFEPDTGHTFCFWAESTTNDWNYALDQFLLFPADWQIAGAYDAGPTTCDNDGTFGPFDWYNFQDRPFEVVVDHHRDHANPSDRCYTLICFDALAGGPAESAPISWYWDSDEWGESPYHPCSDDGYTPEGKPECDEMIYPPATIPACGPPLWEKWVNGEPWEPGINLTAETYDTFTVVDTFNTGEPFVLEEYWTEGQLALVDVIVEPEGVAEVVIDAEYIIVTVPGGLVDSLSVTKVYQLQPCTWTSTMLQEDLYVGGQLTAQQPITIYKESPNLWTGSSYDSEVTPGETAQITFNFGNSGGYENDVVVRGEFPAEALYQSATPAPDRVDPGGQWAEWDVGDLAYLSSGSINVSVAVQSGLVTSTTLEVWNFVWDHTGAVADSNLSTLHVQELWQKWIDNTPWTQGYSLTTETYDTFTVVDTFNTSEPFVLEEYWTEGHLVPVDFVVEPEGVADVVIDAEYIIVTVPGGLVESLSVTKVYAVLPCTWISTTLQEDLYVGGQLVDQRPVTIHKESPALWTSSTYDAEVRPGQTAQVTFNFGNNGGYENDVVVRGEFPDEALYQDATPTPDRVDPEGRWAEWDVGDLAYLSSGSINVSVGVQSGLVTSTSLEVWNFVWDHTGAVADSNLSTLHVQELWQKWILGVPWTAAFSLTTETLDTFTVIDQFQTSESFVLEEYWTEGQLALIDVIVEPVLPEIGLFIDDEHMVLEVPGGLVELLAIAKVYQVQPCTWTSTVIDERLYVNGQLFDERPVTIHKESPALWTSSTHDAEVRPGETAQITFNFGNNGGYENDVVVRGEFPAEALYQDATPAPDRVDPEGQWAEWDVGDLAYLSSGSINVSVGVQSGLVTSTSLEVWNFVWDHTGAVADSNLSTLHVQELWQKWILGVPWTAAFSLTTETLDTFTVIDQFQTSESFVLEEYWTEGQLALIDVIVEPNLPEIGLLIDDEHMVLEVPGGLVELLAIAKVYQVQPCTWTSTVIDERLYVNGQLFDERPVTIHKRPPDLNLGGAAKTLIEAGSVASYTLSYANFGGYENDVSIRSDFPTEASYHEATPLPDRVDPAGKWAEWDLGDLAELDFGNIAVYFDVQPGLPNFTQFDILSHIYDHVDQPVAAVTMTFEITGTLPLWEKRVNDQPWSEGMSLEFETYDNFEVVDTFNTFSALTHAEYWDPDRLQLLEVAVWPAGVAEPIIGSGSVTVTFPAGDPESIEVVKLFHVRPCTWTQTTLVEELRFGEELIEQRPLTVTKKAPDLGLGGAAKTLIEAGRTASYTLSYANFGGYENDVSVRSDFPAEAPFDYAAPAPDRTDPAGTWAEWDLGDLAGLDFGNIAVYFDVQPGLPNFTQFQILSHLYDHVDQPAAAVTMTFEITGTPPIWEKYVADQPWESGFVHAAETYDNFEVVDTFNTFRPFTHTETWDPDHLQLLEVGVWPDGVAQPQVEPGSVTIVFPEEDPETIEVVKIFHVLPCTWTTTILTETMIFADGDSLVRPLTVTKQAPDLGLGGSAKTLIEAGSVASYTLSYANFGGYENDVSIRSDFPAEASYHEATPLPDRVDPAGKWAEWDLGDLAEMDFDNIAVHFDVQPGLPNFTQFQILSHIYDHVDQPAATVTMTFEITGSLPLWEKQVNDQPWSEGMSLEFETYDNFEVVDTFNTFSALTHAEYWDPDRLQLLEVAVWPAGVAEPVIGSGSVTVTFPAGDPESIEVVKLFHVRPCTWTQTTLVEELRFGEELIEQRPLTVTKKAPDLGLGGAAKTLIEAGRTASYTLSYANFGGYENDVSVRSDFPAEASYHEATPLPDRVDPAGKWAEWDLGDLAGLDFGNIAVYFDVQPGLPNFTQFQILSHIYDHVDQPAAAVTMTLEITGTLPLWEKQVNDQPWHEGFSLEVETYDNFQVVDTFNTVQPFTHTETWNPDRLQLLEIAIWPEGVTEPVVEPDSVTVTFPEGDPETIEVVKIFHVLPCTWTTTILTETMIFADGDSLVRPLTVTKQAPDLGLGGAAKTQIQAGSVASYTLSYANYGGYENDVSLRSDFPAQASFDYATPAPDRADPAGTWAEWDLGDLAGLDFGNIAVYFDVQPGLPNFSQFQIPSHIYDHVDQPAAAVTMTFEITGTLPLWEKQVNDQPWHEGFSLDVETYDNFQVVDTFNTVQPFTHTETWDPDHLQLLEIAIWPEGVTEPVVEPDSVTVTFPEGDPETIEVVKIFHVLPCTWTTTILTETMIFADDDSLVRPLTVIKQAPDLGLGGAAKSQIQAGSVASYSLHFANYGGYENDVSVRSDFPAQASFNNALPAPDRTDPAGTWAEWDLGDLAGLDFGNIAVNFDVQPGLPNFTQFQILNHLYDHVDQPAAAVTMTFEITGSLPAPIWEKWIEGQLWRPGISLTLQTSDTFEVVNRITNPEGVTLLEEWASDHLSLSQWRIEPEGVTTPSTGEGTLRVDIPAGEANAITLTEIFNVRPCTWTETLLTEELRKSDEVLESRSVAINKTPPLLDIDAFYDPHVEPGARTSFTISYGNNGGYENDVTVAVVFPPDVTFESAAPPPTLVNAVERTAIWDVGALATDQGETIVVTLTLAAEPIGNDPLVIAAAIYNHIGQSAAETAITYLVLVPRIYLPAIVNGVRMDLQANSFAVDISTYWFTRTKAGEPENFMIHDARPALVPEPPQLNGSHQRGRAKVRRNRAQKA